MANKMRSLIALTSLFIFLMAPAASFADAGIKARMKSRLPAIMQLKAKGIVGENHLGYLEFVGKSRKKAAVVAAENADRKKVYTAIAKKNKTTIQNVGARRALQIAQRATSGHMIKGADGKWRKK